VGRAQKRTVGLLWSISAAVVLALAMTFAVGGYDVRSAQAHNLGETSVRGGNIRWADGPDFKYKNARGWAVKQWNRLPKVPILRDTDSTDRDLEFKMYHQVELRQAYYDYRPPDVDKIWFNRYQMDRFGTYDREAVAVHELGHALKLDHVPRTRYWKNRSIMWWDAKATRFHSWQRHDKSDYYKYW
jgi:hypothetical protein